MIRGENYHAPIFFLMMDNNHSKLDPKPVPLAVFAAEFSSAENPPKRIRLAVFAAEFSSAENPPKKFG